MSIIVNSFNNLFRYKTGSVFLELVSPELQKKINKYFGGRTDKRFILSFLSVVGLPTNALKLVDMIFYKANEHFNTCFLNGRNFKGGS